MPIKSLVKASLIITLIVRLLRNDFVVTTLHNAVSQLRGYNDKLADRSASMRMNADGKIMGTLFLKIIFKKC